jgi:hypothetical protein
MCGDEAGCTRLRPLTAGHTVRVVTEAVYCYTLLVFTGCASNHRAIGLLLMAPVLQTYTSAIPFQLVAWLNFFHGTEIMDTGVQPKSCSWAAAGPADLA